MKILVLVKPVPDPDKYGDLKIDSETKRLVREGVPTVINPTDRNALEAAFVLREKHGGTVTVLSMAPEFARTQVVEALAMGADEAFLLSDPAFGGADTFATSYVLSQAADFIAQNLCSEGAEGEAAGFDLILAGNESADGATSQVPTQVAEWLGLPHVCRVNAVEITDGRMLATKHMEAGDATFELGLPAVLGISRSMNKPRLVNAMGIVKARKKPLTILSNEDMKLDPDRLGLKGSPTQAGRLITPDISRAGEALARDDGTPAETAEEAAQAILKLIRQAGVAVNSEAENRSDIEGADAAEGVPDPATLDHMAITAAMEKQARESGTELIILPADSVGEEVAPALGVRLGTGVASHCVDITTGEDGKPVFMVPAFGGRVIGEILIPDAAPGRPAIATANATLVPGYIVAKDATFQPGTNVTQNATFQPGTNVTFLGFEKARSGVGALDKAEIIFCGGYGIGAGGKGAENWEKLERLAAKFGGAAGCTRPVVDAGWGPDEYSMIGTSGRQVKPRLYIGFGISGAAHHLCGIKDSDVIVNINNDRNAEVLKASDHTGIFDAGQVIDALLEV